MNILYEPLETCSWFEFYLDDNFRQTQFFHAKLKTAHNRRIYTMLDLK